MRTARSSGRPGCVSTRHPPGADTPLGADTPPEPDTPPRADTPQEQTPPGSRHSPPP